MTARDPQQEDSSVDALIAAACDAQARAYAPYSNFQVGAALATAQGAVFQGCNVENASYGGTICAERVAAAAAVVAGDRVWKMLVVASPHGAVPCGICRQFLAEFQPDLPIVLYDAVAGTRRLVSLSKLHPHPFANP